MIVPEILKECLPLGLLTTVLAFLIGLALWIFGGLGHRFCIVLATTLVAGVIGLQKGPVWGLQPLVAGLLLAVSAGALALSLVRVLVFLGVGFGVLFAAQAVAPNWDEAVACFVGGGILGVVFFQFWVQAAASLTGTLLMAYSGLCLVARLGRADVVAWAEKNGPLLNWGTLSVATLGILVQILVQKRGLGSKSKAKPKPKPAAEAKPAAAPPPPPPPAPPPPPPPRPFWLRWLPQGTQKKAG